MRAGRCPSGGCSLPDADGGAGTIVLALAGNPNSGKTTLFNALTGARRHVGNYPGVTVELDEGRCAYGGARFRVVDLPGAYSLAAASPEEAVTRDFLLKQRPDVVAQVVDASNLERGLYLAVQLRELGVRLILVLNMADVAKARGIEFDLKRLSALLDAPVVPAVASRADGIDALLREAARAAAQPASAPFAVAPPEEIAAAAEDVAGKLPALEPELAAQYPVPWLAARLVEDEPELKDRLRSGVMRQTLDDWTRRIAARLGQDPAMSMVSARHAWISGVAEAAARRAGGGSADFSDRIDRVLLHRILGLPIFLVLMFLVFHLVFTLGGPPMAWIEDGFGWLGDRASSLWPPDAESDLRSLLVDGLVAGLGGVLTFLPNILLLFLAIAFLEGTGYMARAAFLMDRIMRKAGLQGKSFIPMLLGFGCTVPAIMATRTLERRRDRLVTILVLPFMSCGARLPIYALLLPVFFPECAGALLWLLYFIGIVFAILGAKLLRSTLFRGEPTPFLMELPPYRAPAWRSVILLMGDRGKEYITRAGTIILAASVALWALATYPKLPADHRAADYAALEAEAGEALAPFEAGGPALAGLTEKDRAEILADLERRRRELDAKRSGEAMAHSALGWMGSKIEPVIKPLGFDRRIGTALVGALAGKEMLVAQLGIVFAKESAGGASEPLRAELRKNYDRRTAFALMLFCLLSCPCAATTAACRGETRSWKYALGQALGLTATAYLATWLFYQASGFLA